MSRKILRTERWAKIKPLLPPERGSSGRPGRPHRKILEGIFWVLRTGAPCRDLPIRIDNENYSLDGSMIKAHQDACRVKKS